DQHRGTNADLVDDVAPELRLARAPDRLLGRLSDVRLESARHVSHAVAQAQLRALVLLLRAGHCLRRGIRDAHPSFASIASSRSVISPSCRATSSTAVRSPRTSSREGRFQSSAKPREPRRSEEHTSELQSLAYLVCRLLLEKKKVT